jgi:hypothetical protein
MCARKQCANNPHIGFAPGCKDYICPLWIFNNGFFDESGFQIDHILEVTQGGTNDIHNLQVLCPCCHSVKTKRAAKQKWLFTSQEIDTGRALMEVKVEKERKKPNTKKRQASQSPDVKPMDIDKLSSEKVIKTTKSRRVKGGDQGSCNKKTQQGRGDPNDPFDFATTQKWQVERNKEKWEQAQNDLRKQHEIYRELSPERQRETEEIFSRTQQRLGLPLTPSSASCPVGCRPVIGGKKK